MISRPKRIFANRTLNLRSIRAIGYDMDYTLVHYAIEEWEGRAYARMLRFFSERGWPVDGMEFDARRMIRGLIIDTELGNILKADRFGYVKQALHGTREMDFKAMRETYARIVVDLAESRFYFLNTLFSLSESLLYAQLVDRLDRQEIPEVLGYHDLFHLVRRAADDAHMEDRVKAEIVADPARFVETEEALAQTLLDQKLAGKRLLLITNSEWGYTRSMMSYAFDRFLASGTTWRDLFDVVIVSARKPDFFSGRAALFEVVNDEGLLRPYRGKLRDGGVYLGGSAHDVEEYLGVPGEEVLYVGDHMFGDVHVTKSLQRWRTALVVRELEGELVHDEAFEEKERRIGGLMDRKQALEEEAAAAQLALLHLRSGSGPQPTESKSALNRRLGELRAEIARLDGEIGPLARDSTARGDSPWGPLMWAGNEKSHFARQMERHADLYTSRVSNFLLATPFAYLRATRGSLPHDPIVR